MPRKIEVSLSSQFHVAELAEAIWTGAEREDVIELVKHLDAYYEDWEFSRLIWQVGQDLRSDYYTAFEDDPDFEPWEQ